MSEPVLACHDLDDIDWGGVVLHLVSVGVQLALGASHYFTGWPHLERRLGPAALFIFGPARGTATLRCPSAPIALLRVPLRP